MKGGNNRPPVNEQENQEDLTHQQEGVTSKEEPIEQHQDELEPLFTQSFSSPQQKDQEELSQENAPQDSPFVTFKEFLQDDEHFDEDSDSEEDDDLDFDEDDDLDFDEDSDEEEEEDYDEGLEEDLEEETEEAQPMSLFQSAASAAKANAGTTPTSLKAKKTKTAAEDKDEEEKEEKAKSRVAQAWQDFDDELHEPMEKGQSEGEQAGEAIAKLLGIGAQGIAFAIQAGVHPQQGFQFASGKSKEDWKVTKEYVQGKVDDAKEAYGAGRTGYKGIMGLIQDLNEYSQRVRAQKKPESIEETAEEDIPKPEEDSSPIKPTQPIVLSSHRQPTAEPEPQNKPITLSSHRQPTAEPEPQNKPITLSSHRQPLEKDPESEPVTLDPHQPPLEEQPLSSQEDLSAESVQEPAEIPQETQPSAGEASLETPPEVTQTTAWQPSQKYNSKDAINALESVIEPSHNTVKQIMIGIQKADPNSEDIPPAIMVAAQLVNSTLNLTNTQLGFQVSDAGADPFMQAFTRGEMPVAQQAEEFKPSATMLRQGQPSVEKFTKTDFIPAPPPPPAESSGEAPSGPAASEAAENPSGPTVNEPAPTAVKSGGGMGGRK